YERAFERSGANLSFFFLAREDHFAIREDYLSCLQRENPDLVVLTQPANPAGNLIAEERRMEIWRYCKEHGIFLLVDECFLSLVKGGEDHTMLPFLVQDPNLMVLRAFTKTYAMPGLRLGFVLSSNLSLLLQMASYQPEWSVSVMAQQAGIHALQEETYLQDALRLIEEERDFLRRGLRERGMEVFFSEANFLLFFTDKDVAEPLLKKGILIRNCSNYRGLGRGYYRVAVKKRKENEELLGALDEVLEEERTGEIHGVHTSFTGRN
ncbi:MAG: aminotransferase class I/II-fold pyridoxal phosphate-dependent enzyme, partial [Lachnospiraceae bacterium]|nr:aminotransferase class I/II-fold pyridoxal phosphate-dependent enzyme [Lachnospiraceae bacterium]